MKRFDYVDAFAIDLLVPDDTPPAVWLGAGLSQVRRSRTGSPTDGVPDRQRRPAGRLADRDEDPDTVHLVVDLPVMHVDLIGHNDSARTAGASPPC